LERTQLKRTDDLPQTKQFVAVAEELQVPLLYLYKKENYFLAKKYKHNPR